ncbi:MAG: PilZ domain-containing protein [Desulfomonile tiedjei]|uniref:PilZ domain-containing protein n=1 Tax=Desulfomonile tiedjei TaxID=2358 RepID=A0A9D6Z551_9BACT|nr:PilZ domain-containing protein [Desulfomonile tiedjei]
MNTKRKIRAKEVIHDIRNGMNPSDLMAKYQFTLKGLRTAFQKLVEVQALNKSELNDLRSLYDISVKGLRQFRRKQLSAPLKIYDGGDPFKSGIVKDISEKGICIQGIQAEVGDLKNFIIRLGLFGHSPTMVFEARCRWIEKDLASGKTSLAGFEITNISSLDSRELNRLIAT